MEDGSVGGRFLVSIRSWEATITMKIQQGKMVKMEYELTVVGGDVIESSSARGPLAYIHGTGKLLPGLEKRIEGLVVGDEKDGIIPAAEAFGTQENLPTKVIPRSDFPSTEEVKAGSAFQAKDTEGTPLSFTVVAIEGDQVTVRFDHPLAGKDIRFKVKILEISDPN
jgi:FKBP-type peptidyl-prolyl cis-trans isomerase SlyD